ncbi:MAG: bifunctional folylpolyglutamate synthase/dihydrofolate synthase [Gammaproteobacteria bacterium]
MTDDAAPFGGGGVDEWLRALSVRHPRAIDMELTRAEKVRAALNLHLPMPAATVGGTNGKGSVCALADAMLRAGGVRVGLYTSPHLLHFRERIRIHGEPVADRVLTAAFAKVEKARAECRESLTYFEFTTLAAALIFAEAEVDAVILEVGLGGRLDAVNLFPPAVAAVTNIGLDHQEFLGGDIDSIAAEKAGIFRRGCPAIVADADAPASLLAAAADAGADLRVCGRDFAAEISGAGWHYRGRRELFSLPPPAMRGRHQMVNAAAAIAILESMPENLWPGAGAVRRGLHSASAPGRAQVLPGVPTTVLDVAHNAAAAAALERMLFDMGYYPKTAAVLGMLARKNAADFARTLHRRVDQWFVARPEDGDRDAETTAREIAETGARAQVCDSVAAAARAAREYCGNDGRIVVTGSFMTVADYMRNFRPRI